MKVVVTDGPGFIGSSLAGELAKSRKIIIIEIENLDHIHDETDLSRAASWIRVCSAERFVMQM